jgi:hypothetical protein
MKILHALVGYLAVTALPFHPFTFASPNPRAGIDYDGYVDITQNHIDVALMNHVLDNILETCQTVTSHSLGGYANATQNHSDSAALMKRVPGDIAERAWAGLAPQVLIVVAIVAAVVLSVVWIEGDDPVRGNDVEFLRP